MARSFDRFTLPADLALTPCAHCGTYVESVDSRRRCDDCASDSLLAMVEEVSIVDTATALHLGALSYARRELAALERDLSTDPDFIDDCRARWHAAIDHAEAQRLPWQMDWTPADAVTHEAA